jgi:RNA-directed DNA polymerase
MPSEITVTQLFEAYYDCRRAKRNTRAALAFEVNLEENLIALLRELQAGTWEPSPATVFAITRPKPREVWAADFRDRIVHHLVYRAIAPLFEPSFIADSCACIPGRGTLYGAKRLRHHILSASENWTKPAFVLKADIANFFGSIRHADLFAMLARRVKDATMLELCRRLVFQDVRLNAIQRGDARHMAMVPHHKSLFHAPPGTGLPIGNLSSQFFANVYLDGLDQMIKRRLRMRRYVRYVDDMVLVHPNPKALLGAADAIREHLAGIGLKLAESKTSIAPAERGVDFVGQVIRPYRTIGRAKTHRAALHRLATMPRDDLPESVNSYLGLFRHSGSRGQCVAIARIAHQRGLKVSWNLNKVRLPGNPQRRIPGFQREHG